MRKTIQWIHIQKVKKQSCFSDMESFSKSICYKEGKSRFLFQDTFFDGILSSVEKNREIYRLKKELYEILCYDFLFIFLVKKLLACIFLIYDGRAKSSVTNRLPWFYPRYILKCFTALDWCVE